MDAAYAQKIKQWVELDNTIEVRKSKLKFYQDEKKKLEDEILDYIDRNDMQDVQININDGKIRFQEMKNTPPLTLKSVKDALVRFFESHANTSATADTIFNYILKGRESKSKLTIKRQVTNQST